MEYELIAKREEGTSALYQVLYNRGIDDPTHYLHVNDQDIINPATIKNIRSAAECLTEHIASGHNIFINVD